MSKSASSAATYALEAYTRLREENHPFKRIAEEMNRLGTWGKKWDGKKTWLLLYNDGGKTIPRKQVIKGSQDNGVPKDRTVPEGCVSEDDAIRYITVLLDESPTDKNPYTYAAEYLNKNDLFVTQAKLPWRSGTVERFFRENTRDEPTNRLRSKHSQCQVWPLEKLGRYLRGLKESGYTHDAIVEWLNREKIIHHRWKRDRSHWTKTQLTGVLTSYKSIAKRGGRPTTKPRQPALDFVATHEDYQIWMPDDIIVHIFDLRAKGINHTAEQYAAYLNRLKVIRGNYTRGNHLFTGAQLSALFQGRGITFVTKVPPKWVEQRLEKNDKADAADETPEPEVADEVPAEVVAKPEPAKISSAQSDMSMKFSGLQVTKDGYTASADVEVGRGHVKINLSYEGTPDVLLSAVLEKLFGMKISY